MRFFGVNFIFQKFCSCNKKRQISGMDQGDDGHGEGAPVVTIIHGTSDGMVKVLQS